MKQPKKLSCEQVRAGRKKLLVLFGIFLLTGFLYYFTNGLFPYAFLFFYGVAILLGFGYVIANRCFSRNGVTYEDLPVTMTPDERNRYLLEREERKRATAWMLYLLIPLLFVIGIDFFILFIGEPLLAGIKGGK